MNILITGGAGFIGSYIAKSLSDEGHNITIYDNFTRNSLKLHGDISKDIDIVEGDICDEKLLSLNMSCKDMIVHCAAICGIHSVNKPLDVIRANTVGAYNVINNLKQDQKLIMFSSCEVDGLYPEEEEKTFPLFEPRWSYALSKVSCEYMVQDIKNCVVIRPYNVFGPYQSEDSAIINFIKHMLTDRKIMLYKPGTQIRSWCYIDDFIKGFARIFSNFHYYLGKIINIGANNTVSNIVLVNAIAEELRVNEYTVDMKDHFCTDIEVRKYYNNCGHDPAISLEEGIRCTANWIINSEIGT